MESDDGSLRFRFVLEIPSSEHGDFIRPGDSVTMMFSAGERKACVVAVAHLHDASSDEECPVVFVFPSRCRKYQIWAAEGLSGSNFCGNIKICLHRIFLLHTL